MKTAASFAIVLVTAPNAKVARRVARAALDSRLAACANLIPAVESHYWWQGKIQRGKEVLIIFKTARRRLPSLEKLVLQEHPYDTPEFLVLTLKAGNERYLGWLADSLKREKREGKREKG
jgi:periplasmic divalent cation tolerance protein